VTIEAGLAVLILGIGAISSTEEIAPGQAAAPPASSQISATTDESLPIGMRLVWTKPASDPTKSTVEVVGADPAALQALARAEITPEGWTSCFTVRVVQSAEPPPRDLPPLLGSYRVTGATIRFQPRFGLEPGMRYRAEFDPVKLHALAQRFIPSGRVLNGNPHEALRLVADYSPPVRPRASTTEIAAVYPASRLLPENLLRFYLVFSAPMSRGEAYRRISLIDVATGNTVDSPFLELDEELWSPDGTRFTLLLDPGRVKRGLKPREELGPVLEAGKSYILKIDGTWPDAAGNPLKTGIDKPFRTREPDESSPDPKAWRIVSPPADSREPLEVRFPEPLDRALLDRLIWVQDVESKVVAGQVSVGEAETRWRFTPVRPWRAANYRLVIGTELEDVAGNSVARPFEVDVAGPISERVTTRTVELPFQVARAPH
jgi:hypothetical protein